MRNERKIGKRTGRMCRVSRRRGRGEKRNTASTEASATGRREDRPTPAVPRPPLTGGRAVELERVAEDGQRRRSGERAERRDELEAPAGGQRDQRDGHA